MAFIAGRARGSGLRAALRGDPTHLQGQRLRLTLARLIGDHAAVRRGNGSGPYALGLS